MGIWICAVPMSARFHGRRFEARAEEVLLGHVNCPNSGPTAHVHYLRLVAARGALRDGRGV